MREVKVLLNLIGRTLCLESSLTNPIIVMMSVDVTAFCSPEFIKENYVAVVEYGRQSNGDQVVHFKTLFHPDECNSYKVSERFGYKKGPQYFLELLKTQRLTILRDWGIDLSELTEIVFRFEQ